MENINQRFVKIIESLGVSGYKIAKGAGISEGTITNIRQGRNKPNTDLIEWLLQKYDTVSAEYLLRGEGEVFRSDGKTGINESLKEQLRKDVEGKGTGNYTKETDCHKLLKSKDETIAALKKAIDLYERMLKDK